MCVEKEEENDKHMWSVLVLLGNLGKRYTEILCSILVLVLQFLSKFEMISKFKSKTKKLYWPV